MEQQKGLVLTPEELHANGIKLFNQKQLQLITQRTNPAYVKQRKAKGGGTWNYVKGSYVKKMLNLVFGFDWDFVILKSEYDLVIGQAYVHGRLTVRVQGKTIIKEQFGRADIKFKTEWINGKKQSTSIPLDLGNDLKASSTDALKKCASELGFFQDIYDPEDYVEFDVTDTEEKEAIKINKLTDRINAVIKNVTTIDQLDQLQENFLNSMNGLATEQQIEIFKTKRQTLKSNKENE